MFVRAGGRLSPAAIVLAVVFVFFALAGCVTEKPAESGMAVTAEQWKQVEHLNAAADEFYRQVMDGRLDGARAKLEEVSGKMTDTRFTGIASVEGVGALSDAIVYAKRVLSSSHYSAEEGQAAAAQIRLATDALTHANQPMWLQYYKGMKELTTQFGQAVQARNKPQAESYLNQLQSRYATIRPSLLISRTPSDVEKLDSLFVFMRKQLSQTELDLRQLDNGLMHMHTTLDELFGRSDRAAYMPIVQKHVPLTWVLVLGSIIVAVLSFAAWRIFDFERNSFGGGHRGGGW